MTLWWSRTDNSVTIVGTGCRMYEYEIASWANENHFENTLYLYDMRAVYVFEEEAGAVMCMIKFAS